jgi:hypothetical protein
MGGGNFHQDLTVDARGHVAPSGPLPLARDERMEALYAWVIQENGDKTGAVCLASEEEYRFLPRTEEWQTRNEPKHWGEFRAGPAVGIAVAISKLGNAREPFVHWWSDSLLLTKAGAGRAGPPGEDGNRRLVELLEEILHILRGGGGAGLQAGQGLLNPGGGGGGGVAGLVEEALRRVLRG